MNNLKSITLNDKILSIAEVLIPFTIQEKPSSNVAYFGTDIVSNRLFVQFKNGSSYIYKDVPSNLLEEIHTAESVGKYFSQYIAGKFQNVKYAEKLVNIQSVLD